MYYIAMQLKTFFSTLDSWSCARDIFATHHYMKIKLRVRSKHSLYQLLHGDSVFSALIEGAKTSLLKKRTEAWRITTS